MVVLRGEAGEEGKQEEEEASAKDEAARDVKEGV